MRKVTRFLACTTIPACVLLPISAMAQSTDTPGSPPAPTQSSDRPPSDNSAGPDIVITGTSIRGVAPTGSSLISVTRDAIEKTSAQTTDQLLSTVPNLGNFGQLATATTFIPVGTNPSIHGIGSSATLTLIDGYRFAASGVQADPSIIPLLAIERLEIVPDGASSIYGSDAVAGVVNLRTRKDYEGVGASAQYGTADSYNSWNASLIAGGKWKDGSAYIVYDHSWHSDLTAGDRPFTRLDQTSRGGGDYRYNFCSPATITVGVTTYALPGLVPGTANKCDNGGVQDLLPRQTRDTVFAKVSQNLSSSVRLYGSLTWSKLHQVDQIAQGNVAVTVPSTNPYYISPPGAIPGTETVNFNLGQDFGATVPFYTDWSTTLLNVGLEANLNSNWVLTLNGNYNFTRQSLEGRGVETAQLQAAVNGTTLATAYNPYGMGPATNPAVLAALNNSGLTFVRTQSQSLEGAAKIDGTLFSIGGGDVKLAIGGVIRHEKTDQSQLGSAAQPGGGLMSPILQGGGPRTIKSVYGEIYVPLVGANNSLPLIRSLELSASARYDDYSDVGSTTNPKFGVNWSPFAGLKLHGSWGTSFNAPSLGDLHAVDTRIQTAPALFGPVFGNLLVLAGGKPTLKPQTADTWSAGGEFKPKFAPGLSISATYFHISYKDLIAIPDLAQVLGGNPAFSQYITLHPTQAQIDATLAQAPLSGVIFTPVGTILDLRRTNLGQQITGGVDIDLSYTKSTSIGTFSIGGSGTLLTDFKTAADSSSPLVDTLHSENRFHARAFLSWDYEGIGASAFFNYTGSYDNLVRTPVQRVDAFKTVDLNLTYTFKGNSGFPAGTQLVFGVDNVFDQDPPLYDSIDFLGNTAGYDLANASPMGRLITFGLRTKF